MKFFPNPPPPEGLPEGMINQIVARSVNLESAINIILNECRYTVTDPYGQEVTFFKLEKNSPKYKKIIEKVRY